MKNKTKFESSTSSPSGNQVDGLPPPSSFLATEKLFLELILYSFHVRQYCGPPRDPVVCWNVSIDVTTRRASSKLIEWYGIGGIGIRHGKWHFVLVLVKDEDFSKFLNAFELILSEHPRNHPEKPRFVMRWLLEGHTKSYHCDNVALLSKNDEKRKNRNFQNRWQVQMLLWTK